MTSLDVDLMRSRKGPDEFEEAATQKSSYRLWEEQRISMGHREATVNDIVLTACFCCGCLWTESMGSDDTKKVHPTRSPSSSLRSLPFRPDRCLVYRVAFRLTRNPPPSLTKLPYTTRYHRQRSVLATPAASLKGSVISNGSQGSISWTLASQTLACLRHQHCLQGDHIDDLDWPRWPMHLYRLQQPSSTSLEK